MDLSKLNSIIPSWGSPTLEGFDTNSIQDGQRLKGSARQFVRFYSKKFLEPYATKVKINEKTGSTQVLETGMREVEREMVTIITPGDKNSVDDFAQDFHRREHWGAYKAFREGKTAPLGMPLEESGFVSSHVATELKFHGCHTIEQLAEASDLLCNNIPDGFTIREYARAMCKAQNENKTMGHVVALRSELDKSRKEIEELKKLVGHFSVEQSEAGISQPEQIAQAIEEAPKRKGGRPRRQRPPVDNLEG